MGRLEKERLAELLRLYDPWTLAEHAVYLEGRILSLERERDMWKERSDCRQNLLNDLSQRHRDFKSKAISAGYGRLEEENRKLRELLTYVRSMMKLMQSRLDKVGG